ncbi:MAG: hypothetical protein D6725_17090 [Planctomycetota bacterium]|nr:MAG: hypothetical protein D6725_17090 [Planctomycetota bacterium]
MFSRIANWLDDRTGYRRFIRNYRERVLPRGPSWWYTSASCLFWLLVIEAITGVLLMLSYSPSLSSAWASVRFIEGTPGGAFIRGLHYWVAQALVVLFLVHMTRVVATAAFRAPRELVWITGLLLFPCVLVWAISGNPLSGGQRGLAQIEVESRIIGSTPLIGEHLRRLLLGGDAVGNLTLTHLYTLHCVVIPAGVLLLLSIHISQVYRHGLAPTGIFKRTGRPTPYWPHQTTRNLIALAILVAGLSYAAARWGAPRDVPADPELEHVPRPEWYFLALFELRRHFSGDSEIIATLVIPAAALFFLLALPFLDRVCPRRVSVALRTFIVLGGLGAWGVLTYLPWSRDRHDAAFLAARAEERRLAERAYLLASAFGVPPEGGAAVLRNDPKTWGPILFRRHCAACHPCTDAAGRGIAAEERSAPNLWEFGSAAWIAGLLDPERIAGPDYFGGTNKRAGDMVETVRSYFDGLEEQERRDVQEKLRLVAAALAAEAGRPGETLSAEDVRRGRSLMVEEFACTDCHRFHDEGELGSAPDLTGYASQAWIEEFVADPERERFYGDNNDRMPAFAAAPCDAAENTLKRSEIRIIARWLRGDWYEANEPASPSRAGRSAAASSQ